MESFRVNRMNFWRVVFFVSLFTSCANQMEAETAPVLHANGLLYRDSLRYSFVNDSLSDIEYPSASHARRDSFFAKMDSVILCREGKVSILHIGGSHVQADVFSHTVRCLLDSVNDDFKPARGLFFPYQVAKTNNPTNYKVTHKGQWTSSRNVKKERSARLGMTGIAVTTSDPSAEIKVKFLPSDSVKGRWRFNHLTLLGYADTATCVPVVRLSDTLLIFPVRDKEMETYRFELPVATDSFTLSIIQKDSIPAAFTVCGFLAENGEKGVTYHSIGVNGAAVPSYLSCENFERDLQLIHPDLVIFGIGINDAVPENFSEENFIAHYDSLIGEIERVSPDCFYIFLTNNDSYRKVRKNRRTRYVVNRNGLKVEHAFRVLAEKHQGGYWNLFGWMGGLSSMATWEKHGLAQKDKVHFTNKGYTLIGQSFYNALMRSYLEIEKDK